MHSASHAHLFRHPVDVTEAKNEPLRLLAAGDLRQLELPCVLDAGYGRLDRREAVTCACMQWQHRYAQEGTCGCLAYPWVDHHFMHGIEYGV